MRKYKGNVTTPIGFQAAGVYAGIRKEKKDIALVYSEAPCAAGGTFTTNRVKAAPVVWDMELLHNGIPKHAVVLNSGIANACMGQQGVEDNFRMAAKTAKELGITPGQVFTASTGIIGQPLPMDVVEKGIAMAAAELKAEEASGQAAAEAIMTTDTVCKTVACSFMDMDDEIEIHLGGMSKGSGMIHPNMATMLSVVTTDIAIDEALLQEAVSSVVADTFNMISVDRDTSTNDTFLVLANGMAGNPKIEKKNKVYDDFVRALFVVCKDLAKKMARDGEGASKLLEVKVRHAKTKWDAVLASKAVVSSNLVKTAFFGSDANWGRVLCAMGYSGADFDPEKVDISLVHEDDEVELVSQGRALPFSENEATAMLSQEKVTFMINLNDGYEKATAWGCDLSYDYVKINGDYRS
ncbi:MAG: bifunctional glutamate N-acetyltransferase/amino-acid acetyltransferase ArgJ [Lachnospiraceae bacterium]|nr:bifunctional glutamate N-acetyltransferase/amino-acid acetyltransferase ArgJ [Lachnospiraceae bacterium]